MHTVFLCTQNRCSNHQIWKKNSMTNATIIPFRPLRKLIFTFPESDLSRLVAEGYALACYEPRILELIDQDRDAHALAKKKARILDRDWLMSRGSTLPGFNAEVEEGWADELELAAGRPRMAADLVLIFALLRGYLGGFKDRKTAMLLLESRTLETIFVNLGIKLPGLSTILDNINAITSETFEFILDVQIEYAKVKRLDTFKELTGDSTGIEANSSWPTDSGTIAGLAERAERLLRGLSDFGVALKLPAVVGSLIAELNILHKQIQLSFGKKDSAAKRKKLYRKLIKIAKKARQILQNTVERANLKALGIDVMPSLKMRMTMNLDWIQGDLEDLDQAIKNAISRVIQDKKVKTTDKILSLSDEDAAIIAKGGREPLMGYKPQLVRSGNGIVTAIVVPKGNANDSDQLRAVVDASLQRTGIVPTVLSFDDGYTNNEDREYYLGLGIPTVSFSGSKGKRLIPEDEYESKAYAKARNDRSAVESTIFTLKHNHDFGRVMRRGLENVRCELHEKAIAHNFFRFIAIKKTLHENLIVA